MVCAPVAGLKRETPPGSSDDIEARRTGEKLAGGAFTKNAAVTDNQAWCRWVRVPAISGAQRSLFVPDMPTFAEQGFPDRVVDEWFARFAPVRTPLLEWLAS